MTTPDRFVEVPNNTVIVYETAAGYKLSRDVSLGFCHALDMLTTLVDMSGGAQPDDLWYCKRVEH